uniref:mRNA export factor n=1 Tax=Polytomella parva TaxID=51329 RepID=A0A7S0V4M5_9CHLO|mmetsp:Transcript_30295/g.55344  ORF Transcript_30295/g.55344 Transcript_30295/m.55344 type:complete len:375 (+) Transcript_30295:529-1653(+)|eukprot:CAMPEP_0175067492 /NCGR_PEP_ID=MMETSP0052_2-20121109/17130_1 /TAXON_ID=51329 ORGANISM="Polytomella parva, Strain SAG 63-3" /NCGR_SAMPLE_ID=MMETSP0052_2 /ASSEMBLY_ACC=CAM_ASM_000194 /LENGTH=374 /DNA_ID=CAMNT_0016334383 /DNA_START=349 /DNA_END=1473 /DNA_ORIENTATION=-
MFTSSATVPLKPHNPSNDYEVACPLDIEGISSLNFSPVSNFLVATGWNSNAYVWEYDQQLSSQGKAQNNGILPVLCSAWRPDGSSIFLGGCDKLVRLWNLSTNQTTTVAQHDQPIRDCFYLTANNLLATASWDKTVKYWDLRQSMPAHTITLPERPTAMDVKDDCMAVATADRVVHLYDARTGQTAMPSRPSQLRYQIRAVQIFPDKRGYLSSSVEGRVSVTYFQEVPPAKSFTFKCHREGADVYSVNALCFFPQYGTFLSAGSDGNICFWDKDVQQRLKTFPRTTWGSALTQPVSPGQAGSTSAGSNFASIPCATVDRSGSVMAYAVSYDWSKGYSELKPGVMGNYIQLHRCLDEEIKPRPKTTPAPSPTYRR